MIYTVDGQITILAVLLLLALSLVTVEICRRDRAKVAQSLVQFLFQAKGLSYSVASNAGAMFSLTYFFGAAFVYGFFFGYWYLLATAGIFAIVIWLLMIIINQEEAAETKEITGNLLLDRLFHSLKKSEFRIVIRLYAISYACLLVEELAVSRVVLGIMLSPSKLLHLGLLALMCLVVYFYLYLGGFRAVLNSDLVQMAIVGGFLFCLVFTLAREGLPLASGFEFRGTQSPLSIGMNTLFIIIFGASWFVAGVDYYSRLNFQQTGSAGKFDQKRIFVIAGLATIFLVLGIGILFGIHLRQVLPSITTPVDYTAATIEYFLTRTRPAVAVMFIGSIFCMIFTTIDTLLLTLLQLGYLSKSRMLARENLSRVLFCLVFFSALLQENSISAFGIFSGSLLILPATATISVVFPKVGRFLVRDLRALEVSFLLFSLLFIAFYEELELAFEYHFLIPGLLILTILMTSVAFDLYRIIIGKKGGLAK